MTDNKLAPTSWVIPHEAISVSYNEMARDGSLDREGIALWAGNRMDDRPTECRVRRVVLLRGALISRARGFIRIHPELLNEITDTLADCGDASYLIGQIHGHPPYSSTDLSPTDIEFGIRIPEYLSVVAPSYGMGTADISSCGVHVFDRESGWQELSRSEITARISLIRDPLVETCVVGNESAAGSSL
jgi:hypothetical protein